MNYRPFVLLTLVAPALAGANEYIITPLVNGSDAFSRVTFGGSINNSNTIIFESGSASGSVQSFRWQNGVLTNVGNIGFARTWNAGINERGDILATGHRTDNLFAAGNQQAALRLNGGTLVELPGIPGGIIPSNGSTIGQNGIVANWSNSRWLVGFDGSTTNTGLSSAFGINDANWVAGSFGNQAAIWRPGVGITQLGSLGGGTAFPASNVARIVLNNGVVYGQSSGPGFGTPSGNPNNTWFRWSEGTGMVAIGAPFNRTGELFGANNLEQLVGSGSDGTRQWALIHSNGQFRALETLLANGTGWSALNQAYSINDNGWIVGNGTFNGQSRAFLLTPVPEPGTLLALSLGAAALLRRRAKK